MIPVLDLLGRDVEAADEFCCSIYLVFPCGRSLINDISKRMCKFRHYIFRISWVFQTFFGLFSVIGVRVV